MYVTKLVGRIRLFPSVRYCILPGAVWCGAVHTPYQRKRIHKLSYNTEPRSAGAFMPVEPDHQDVI